MDIDSIVNEICLNFRTFGGGFINNNNPISVALQDEPAQFAAGVSVKDVVRFILRCAEEKK